VSGFAIGLADFRQQWDGCRERYLEAVSRVGDSGWLILGKEVAAFEEELAGFWGLPHAIGCGNGLDALEIAFRCAGMRAGDRVLTTPLSAFATTLAILRVGAVPVFADVDAWGLLDLDDAERLTARDEPVRFIVPVHLYGHAMDLDALEAFSHKHGAAVIEDCAQAIGARSRGRPVGAASVVCATSFYPTKNLGAFGDGGAVLTRDTTMRDRARCLPQGKRAALPRRTEEPRAGCARGAVGFRIRLAPVSAAGGQGSRRVSRAHDVARSRDRSTLPDADSRAEGDGRGRAPTSALAAE
jgi:dTDP-4-amino-4,6-dideoxygalactose transaminase